ncbi:hypothetical protein GCM10010368_66950 [Streptomyces roseiscleroticus]|uniref:Uncharacterized protein n=1 Tax=Streptomyces roseiscleroticus TaxID=1972 RepID=A0ABP5S2Z1_9ACTN
MPEPVQRPAPPLWVAVHHPGSRHFATAAQGRNLMVTPLTKGDEEVVDLTGESDTAVAVPRRPGRS